MHDNELGYRNGYAIKACFGRDSVDERQSCQQGDCPSKNKEQDAGESCGTILCKRE
jgi:hypothetical protein